VTTEERAAFTDAAEHVRRIGYQNVKKWWDQLGTKEHIEASMVFNLMGVLDALGLKYYD
jgi:hypothetical protein